MTENYMWKHPVIHDANPQVRHCLDPEELAGRVAQSLVGTLLRIQALERTPSVVLTGGEIANRVYGAVLELEDAELVEWSDIEFWWGDERYVPADDEDRNARQAREALLDRLAVDPARVHEMPSPDPDTGGDVDRAAADYTTALLSKAPSDGPWFDVVMLGVGTDGHCASLFPGRPEVSDTAPVLGVRNSPKPPPTRISLGMETLRRSREVWFIASGSDKAEAVAAAVAGADPADLPAAGPHGSERTLWFVDTNAGWML